MIEPVSRQIRDCGVFLHTDYSQKSEFAYADFKIKIEAWGCPKAENNTYQTIEHTNQ